MTGRKIILGIICLAGTLSCAKDIPYISVEEEVYLIGSKGGAIIVPVTSTGIDDVTITLHRTSKWDVDPSTGDLTPAEPWLSVSKVIVNYPQTKALASYRSAVILEAGPNGAGYAREATVEIWAFNKSAEVKITQAGTSGL